MNANISETTQSPTQTDSIHDRLETYVALLRRELANGIFPTISALNTLNDLVVEAVMPDRKKETIEYGYLHGAIAELDKQWPGIKLMAFVHKLVEAVSKLPVPAKTRIWNKIRRLIPDKQLVKLDYPESDPPRKPNQPFYPASNTKVEWGIRIDEKAKGACFDAYQEVKKLKFIYEHLDDLNAMDSENAKWQELYPLLLSLTSFRDLVNQCPKPNHMERIDFEAATKSFEPLLARAAFLELFRAQLIWREEVWGKQEIRATVQWLHSLMRTEIDEKLRTVFHGMAATREEFKEGRARTAVRNRKGKQREKERMRAHEVNDAMSAPGTQQVGNEYACEG